MVLKTPTPSSFEVVRSLFDVCCQRSINVSIPTDHPLTMVCFFFQRNLSEIGEIGSVEDDNASCAYQFQSALISLTHTSFWDFSHILKFRNPPPDLRKFWVGEIWNTGILLYLTKYVIIIRYHMLPYLTIPLDTFSICYSEVLTPQIGLIPIGSTKCRYIYQSHGSYGIWKRLEDCKDGCLETPVSPWSWAYQVTSSYAPHWGVICPV